MFPNNSSSYDISSKTNAFVQINEEEGDGNVRVMAQSHLSIYPALQVPETRDVMVVVKGEREIGDPNLTVITNHPSPPAPAKIPSAQKCERGSDGSSKMPRAERQNTGALCFVSIKSFSSSNNNNNTISVKESDKFINVIPSQSTTLSNIPQTNDDGDDNESFKICDYYSRWGIPRSLKLRGGGESSLTTGTTGWGSPPTAQSGSTGWNGGSGGGGGGSSGQGSQQGGQQSGSQTGQQWTSTGVRQPQQQQPSNQQSAQQQQQQQQQGGPTSQSQASSTPTSQSQGQGTANTSSSNNGTTSAISNNSNSNSQQGSQGGQSVGQSGQSQQSGGPQQQQQQQQQGGNSGGGGQGQGQQGSSQGSSSWAAAAGKGLSSGSVQGPSSSNNSGTSTKQQMEQLNTMREALYSQDGWGGQNVNQDSNWDIPGSPEPGVKDSGSSAPVPMWKPTINNGTDLWEANLRNGGLPPPQTQPPKTAWGHTPSSNLGGMWGEDDEGDASNVWTGVPPAATGSAPQWTNQPAPIWPGGNKKESEWGGPTNWGDQRDPRDIRSHDIRQMLDPRDHMRATSMDHRGMGGNEVLMQRDSRGSGRLNNGATTEAMWATGAPGPHHHMPHHQSKLPTQPNQPGVNQWPGGGGPPMKDMSGLGGKPTGWEEPSPPAQRRNMPNYDDGTSLWGPQHNRPAMPGQNKVSHWKEMPAPSAMRSVLQCPPGGRVNPNMKPDQPIWAHPQRNGAWTDGMDVGGPWVEDKPAPWMDQPLTPSWQSAAPKHNKCWDSDLDPASSWVHPSKQVSFLQPPKSITKDIIWGSKQFRMLTDMGFKKDDVETALRSANMNLEDALEFLNATRPLTDCWPQQQQRRHADLDPDHTIVNPYPSPQPICIPYPTSGGGGSGGGPNVLSNNNPSLSTVSPAIMQKLLSQQSLQQQQMPFTQQSSRTQQTQQPSTQQLRMLVQQIQMAVQAGYLNQQILNQPLAPQTLLSLNQLLQHIKVLQQLMQQHAMIQVQNPLGKPNPSNQLLQLSVQITKTKQSISNLQNQIAAQQAVYVKQQQQIAAASQNDFFNKSNAHDPLQQSFHSNMSDLSIKDHQGGGTSQQSRLNQWKLPAVDKDSDLSSGNEFSRAPGSTTKPTPGNSSPNINPLLGQPDRTWSSVNRNDCETGWPDSGGDESSSKDWPSSSQPPSQAFSDLVPEFEPGKPWKGNPLKTIEDDPSLTPGSVLRSPLSLPTIKDTVLTSGGSSGGAGKASPTTSSPLDIMPLTPLSLSSSTWSFNPPSTTSLSKLTGTGGGSGNKGSSVGGGSGSSGWGETSGGAPQSGGVGSDLWSSVPKSRGPPPGLAAKPQQQNQQQQQNNNAPTTNGWSSLSGRWSANQPTSWGSTWLLLRNLTPQIDGSTLKTLCVQHGPLQSFHLYLNHGIALAKYTSREEANKAQGALNNCVLGNTTIFAESPSESDVHALLQHLGHSAGGQQGSGSGGGGWRQNKEPTWGSAGATTSSQLWPGTSTNVSSLWADSSDQHRTTPSSLNSFLPGDLLGGESM